MYPLVVRESHTFLVVRHRESYVAGKGVSYKKENIRQLYIAISRGMVPLSCLKVPLLNTIKTKLPVDNEHLCQILSRLISPSSSSFLQTKPTINKVIQS